MAEVFVNTENENQDANLVVEVGFVNMENANQDVWFATALKSASIKSGRTVVLNARIHAAPQRLQVISNRV